MTEGGHAVWMGLSTNPTSIYWTDGSYIQTNSNSNGLKVSYADDNHSAITTEEEGVFISKWGAWPLMKHRKDYCPYTSSYLKYYKKVPPALSISGPATLCDQATYKIENLPPGATVQWSASNNNLQLVSAQDNTAVFKKNGNGTDTVNASIVMGTGPLNVKPLHVWAGSSRTFISSISGKDIPPGQDNFGGGLTLNRMENISYKNEVVFDAEGAESLSDWDVETNSENFKLLESGQKIIVIPLRSGGGFFKVRINNSCGKGSYAFVSVLIKDRDSYVPFSLSPNPATSFVTIQLQEESPENQTLSTRRANKTSSPGVIEIQLWSATSLLRTYKTDRNTYQISVSDLPKGMYFVRVIRDGETHTQKLLKK